MSKLQEKKNNIAGKMRQFRRSLKNENISYGELAEMSHPKYRKHLMKDARLAEAAGISETEFNRGQSKKGKSALKSVKHKVDAEGQKSYKEEDK